MALLTMTLGACKQQPKQDNPFLTEYSTPYGVPPFDLIRYEHYLPAIEQGIAEHNAEVQAIIDNAEEPTWENTILALDMSGATLERVASVMFALESSDNTDEMQAITEQALPLITAHSNEVNMNQDLFSRVKKLYDTRDSLGLDTSQMRMLEKSYKEFVRGGAALPAADRDTLAAINTRLASVCQRFSNNVLGANKVAPVPVDMSTRLDVLTNDSSRENRRRTYEAYTSLASSGEYDNSANIREILQLRQRKARLLGFENYAAYMCDNVMSKTPQAAYDLARQVFDASLPRVKEEVAEMQDYADRHGHGITIEPWDYYYYTELVKAEKYNLSENDTKPYFELNNVVEKGLFPLAEEMFELQIKEVKDVPLYNPEVRSYIVTDKQGELLSVFMIDYFSRPIKRQGAWMESLRPAYDVNGVKVRPIVYNVHNIAKPADGEPCLLTVDQVLTLFHEFGHGLQGMLTQAKYKSQSGTNVDRDFVELPSQINEKWALHPDVITRYAVHYQTGEVIPAELVERIQRASTHGQGFSTCETVGAALLDLEWHMANADSLPDALTFERQVAEKLHMPREIQFRYRSPYFQHIFSGDGYAAGYYTYTWADVLVSDGFDLFRQNGVLDHATATSYKKNILEPGDSRDAMQLYVSFRGHQPAVDALLRDRGLK
ncbi:MAG: M3 family metallopeptidase [Bacteroidaceae bacterium]|nr:M3 family metallopeptidase [Bacteroidaceae bacterium]